MADGFPISTDDAPQIEPRVAWNGDQFLVVWGTSGDEGKEEGYEIAAARVDGDGTVLDPAGIPIATGNGVRGTPDVAANGPFLVTWYDRRRDIDALFATRVDPDGTVGRPGGFEVFAADGFAGPVSAAPEAGDGVFSVAYSRTDPFDTGRAFFRHVWPK